MNTNDLTEKLKEIMVELNHPLSDWYAEDIAKQLAPEIEKLMPRWIPVSEGLPDDGQKVDVFRHGERRINMHFYKSDPGYFTSIDGVLVFWLKDKVNGDMYWTPIMKWPHAP